MTRTLYIALALVAGLSVPARADLILFGTTTLDLGTADYVAESPWVVSGTMATIDDHFTADGSDSEVSAFGALFSIGEITIEHELGTPFDFESFELEAITLGGPGTGFLLTSDTGFASFLDGDAVIGTYTAGVDYDAADFSGVTSVTITAVTGGTGTAEFTVDDISVSTVPEPSSGALMLVAFTALAVGRRRASS